MEREGGLRLNDNPTGIGLPFNQAPDFCGANASGQPLSTLCAALGYDVADRLTSVTEWPAEGVSQRSHFSIDIHDWRRRLRADRFAGESLLFVIVGTREVRVWEEARGALSIRRLLPFRFEPSKHEQP